MNPSVVLGTDIPAADQFILLLFGSLLTLLGVFINSWVHRRTYTSNRLYELRIEALNGIWKAFNEMKGSFAFRIQLEDSEWRSQYASEAEERLTAFRRTIDNSQVVLPIDVINILRLIDEAYYLDYNNTDHKPSEFQKILKSLLTDLSKAANYTVNQPTHTFSLELRT